MIRMSGSAAKTGGWLRVLLPLLCGAGNEAGNKATKTKAAARQPQPNGRKKQATRVRPEHGRFRAGHLMTSGPTTGGVNAAGLSERK